MLDEDSFFLDGDGIVWAASWAAGIFAVAFLSGALLRYRYRKTVQAVGDASHPPAGST